MTKVKKQPFRYFGSNWRIFPKIDRLAPAMVDIDTFLDGFCGSASMTLRRQRAYHEVINDTDGQVVNMLRVLRDPEELEKLIEMQQLLPYSRNEYDLACEWANGGKVNGLSLEDMGVSSAQRALYFLIYQNMGYSGGRTKGGQGWRTSIDPHGRYKLPAHAWAELPEHLRAAGERMRGVYIEELDIAQFVAKYQRKERTYGYYDPPFMADTRNKKDRYSQDGEWDYDRHAMLAEQLMAGDGYIILRHYDCLDYRRWYLSAGWVAVHIKATANGAGARVDTIWLNPALAAYHGIPAGCWAYEEIGEWVK